MSGSEKDHSALPAAHGAALAFGMGLNNKVIQEETPTMRSVAVMSQAPSLGLGGIGNVIGGPRLAKAPPLGFSKPAPLGGLRRSSSAGIQVEKEWTGDNWKVRDLEQVPLDFPLERTHREIHGVSASDVAKKISNTLRLLSVEAEYDGEKAKVKCTTTDMVSFRIRLFSGGEDGLPVVVEVQRRNGSPSSFMRVCRSILDGAEGAEIKPGLQPTRKRMPPCMKGPISGMKCLQSVAVKSTPADQISEGLSKNMELLRSKEKDCNLLGIEGLCLLTDPLKTRPDMALIACKSILSEDIYTEIREELAVILSKDTFLPEEVEDDDATDMLMYRSRHQALVLLSNTLILTSKNGCLAKSVESNKWFGDFIIPTLLDEVKCFETNANNSYEAVCGLTSLASCSDVARMLMKDNSAVEDLQLAFKYGTANHELLANESERTLAALGQTI